MSNGVEVLVKDKSVDGKQEQRKLKLMHMTSLKPHHSSSHKQSLLASAVATFVNNQQMSALFPLHQLMQHNYIIKTCMTTYTYLTTVVQDKRSAISTFETIVSVVTTESLTNLYATNVIADIKPTKTKYMEVKTIQPSIPSNMFLSNLPKIDKRIDNLDEDGSNFDLIQPSESGHLPCTTSCSCSHTKTEGLKTKYTNLNYPGTPSPVKFSLKTTKFVASKLDLRPTNKESLDKTQYGPYEYESSSQLAPTDKIVEKYTEVISDFSDEKDSNSVEESELLTNEQAPAPPKTNKISNTKKPEKNKPEKLQKPAKNKFVVADLLKLGTLGIKGLSQLAPVIEKMTGSFIKRHDANHTTTTTPKPVIDLTPYNVNKRVDSDFESNHSNFPIYIPVDELETSESQIVFKNATLHQNLAWAAEHKHSKSHLTSPKIIHESPLVNGGIPISPGEIITANSDVIVGKPAVGGPLTLAASGIKLQNPVNPPPIDSFVSGNEQYLVKEKPLGDQSSTATQIDDSFDLRPPNLPKSKYKPNRNIPRPLSSFGHQNTPLNNFPLRLPPRIHSPSDHLMKTEHINTASDILPNHGRPAFLDYIPSLGKPNKNVVTNHHVNFNPLDQFKNEDDNSPSSSEVISTRVTADGDYVLNKAESISKPFLVDIQPSRVANVLIPHGTSTALVFAGSSEPHKTGDYVDDPLPYPEPGYFGSFSIDAPQMTNVHNVAPNNKQYSTSQNAHPPLESYHPNVPTRKEQPLRNEHKWKDTKRPDFSKIPPPTSNQETYVRVGPHITVYNPDVYKPNNGDFEKYNNVRSDKQKDGKEIIDKEYENYLAVPPPPPPKVHFNQENNYDKNKPYSQKPIVQTKPVQDMKVFLNIQHPVPKPEQPPPKVTSEIYFAAQSPNPTPTYTIHIPQSPNNYGNNYISNILLNKKNQNKETSNVSQIYDFSVSSPINRNNSIYTNEVNDKSNTYTVTLNTATNVANNIKDFGHVVGSSIAIPVGSSNVGQLNADVPIGTNFAIRVEDKPTHIESYNLKQDPQIDQTRISIINAVGDNRWNTTNANKNQFGNNVYIENNYNQNKFKNKETDVTSMAPSINSHANFPMINDVTTANIKVNIKPVTEYIEDFKTDIKRPAKLIPNIPTNSHGWYSSVLTNEESFNNINNIKIEATTRKIIPLLHDYNKDSVPDFGQKINSVGKPPTDFWSQSPSPTSNFNVGKPFTKIDVSEKTLTTMPTNPNPFISSKPYNINYIPSNLGSMMQPAYDIPIRDNSYETTTVKQVKPLINKIKPVYENSEEIYDGEEEVEPNGDSEGEVSLESMKVPVITSSSENISKSSGEITLLQDEVFEPPKAVQKDTNLQHDSFNPGTQTEKPFGTNNNTKPFQSNTIKPIYDHNSYMKPRPFTVSTAMTLDHQLHQPHWQINQLMINSTNVSYEENLNLNIGEEISTVTTTKASTTPKTSFEATQHKFKRPQRPVFSLKPSSSNNTHVVNGSNIITSTVHIKDKKPLIVEKATVKTTLPTFTTVNLELNRSSSEIIDLSPPPPTLDYNFKPSTTDEIIMGMSPPPPRNPPSIRLPTRPPLTPRPPAPIRTPPPYRAKPNRTLPPRLTTQRPTRKPINRDDISTYRPNYDLINNIKRPSFNRDQPSSQLLPPPREVTRIITPVNEPFRTIGASSVPNIIFPTPISSGWLTSSGIGFSSSFDFGPTAIQFPETSQSSKAQETLDTSSENSYSYDDESSSENIDSISSSIEESLTENKTTEISVSTETSTLTSSKESKFPDSIINKSGKEDDATGKVTVIPLWNKNKTRKPYPIRNEDKKSTTSKNKFIIKPTSVRPPEILSSTRHVSIKKIVRPLPVRPTTITPTNIIESSESTIDDYFIKPSEVLRESNVPTSPIPEISTHSKIDNLPSIFTPSLNKVNSNVKPTHHAGNEIKISDEIVPTKTEFRTTVVTLTKMEPPKTVSSIGYVNLTHTLTVTHTKTSLLSQSEGAFTQTLVLTNTHTSTLVDVITEIYTQVQPTTIIETVTKHIPVPQVEPTPVQEITTKTKVALDDISMSSEENDNLIIRDNETTENIQKIGTENETDNETFFVVMNKSQNGGKSPPINTDIEASDYDITRNEQVNSNGVSQVLFGEILLAGTPYLETTNVVNPTGAGYGKECQPDCKASRNERCQRIDGLMKCVCRPGFARMFPDRPCKPTYTYSVKLALGSQGNKHLKFHESLSDNSSKQYHELTLATHEGINRMVMQSDLRDVYHGVHITGFQPVEIKKENGESFQGVMNDFYVQLSDNAHESRLKEVIEKYLRNNNYSLGGTDVHAAADLVDRLDVSDFDECVSGQFHDCSEHAQCFNLRGTYTCSCLEGFADLSVNSLYPGRICSAEPVGCERCNYHGACYSRDDRRVLCECFQWYAGSTCHINLKVVLISLVVVGALLTVVLAVCAVIACSRRPRPPPRSIVACIQGMPSLHQGAMPSKQRADRRALISERGESGDASSIQNASLPYMPSKRSSSSKKCVMSEPPSHDPPPIPAPAVMIPRARLHLHHSESRDNLARKRSLELSNEAKLISYLESGATTANDEMRRKHSIESSYSANKDRHTNKQGALVSAGFKVSTTIRPDDGMMKDERDDLLSVHKEDLETKLSRFDSLRKSYSQEDISEWTDAERRIGELTLSEARSVGGTLPASTGRAASSTRLTNQEANTMAERDLGSTFLLPHVHLYKPDLTSDVSEFDSL